jgi:hypothetical protein
MQIQQAFLSIKYIKKNERETTKLNPNSLHNHNMYFFLKKEIRQLYNKFYSWIRKSIRDNTIMSNNEIQNIQKKVIILHTKLMCLKRLKETADQAAAVIN